ncbi:MAG: hypothetical protein KatS3mg129_3057 [Leptospiraceae bacterium]|nr:MAG: hypothetical protein KatS3mg129_3057 [Leptospiraceae bacterium]
MRLLILLFIFLYSSIVLYAESSIMSYYNKDLMLNSDNNPSYLYYYKSNLEQYNFSLLSMYKNKNNYSINFNTEIFFNFYKFQIFGGNFYLNTLWNRSVFLRDDFSNEHEFFQIRKKKGVFTSLWLYRYLVAIGYFYLEDLSKGIYFNTKNTIILWDFYKKKYIIYNIINTKKFYSFINIAGEKKQIYGYYSFNYNDKINHFSFFILRKIYWDQYEFFTDQYINTNRLKKFSYYTNLNYERSIFCIDINFFLKGNIIYNKNQLSFKVFDSSIFKIFTGFSYLEKQLENKDKNVLIRYNLTFLLIKNLIYRFNFEMDKNQTIFKLKSGWDKKQRFYIGIFYQNYNIKKIQNSFDFFNVNIDTNFIQNILIDRVYTGIYLETQIKLNNILFYSNYIYQIRYIQSNKKENQILDIKFALHL